MTNDEIADHIAELYRRQQEAHADLAAMRLLLNCLLEQLPIDRAQFLDLATRSAHQLAQVMQRDGLPEHVQTLHRERLNSLLAVVLRALKETGQQGERD